LKDIELELGQRLSGAEYQSMISPILQSIAVFDKLTCAWTRSSREILGDIVRKLYMSLLASIFNGHCNGVY